MKTLSFKAMKEHCSEFVLYKGSMYKIITRNGNSYCETIIYRLTLNGEFTIFATNYDIPNIKYINYFWDDDERIKVGKENLEIAKEWLKTIF